jgi:AcrR family transcriptional regulator
VTDEERQRLRLAPEERREHLVQVARELFADRPYTSVTTADIADAAGVTRSLVYHYFAGIRELFLAVAREGVAGLDDVEIAGVDTPLEERTAQNVRSGLDIVAANRETWLAVIGQAGAIGDPELAQLLKATNEVSVEETLRQNRDVLEDTPATRFALRCFQAMVTEATRAWLAGEVERDAAERLIVRSLRLFLTEVVPDY